MKLVTVITPTYNRAKELICLFNSLKLQRNSFEWLIVDDGSTDETESVVNAFLKESSFPIRYLKKRKWRKAYSSE